MIGGVRFKSVLLLVLAYFLCNFIIIITLYLFLWNILLSFDRECVELYKNSIQKKRKRRNCHFHNDIGLEYWFVTNILKLNEWCKVWKQTERLFLESKHKQCTELKSPHAIWHKNWTIKIYIRLMYFLIANYLCTYLKKIFFKYINKMIAVEKLYFFQFCELKLHT